MSAYPAECARPSYPREIDILRFAQLAVPILACSLNCICAGAEPPAAPGGQAATQIVSLRTRAESKTALTVASSEDKDGKGVTLLATVGGAANRVPGGSVVFTAEGKQIGKVAVANGSAMLIVGTLPAGFSSLSAAYEGDNNFLPSRSATVRFYNDEN